MLWNPNPSLYPCYLRSRIRRGKGVGEGQDYKPWLGIRDVPSRGTSSSVLGIKVNRPHHTLSELETIYLYLVERTHSVVDIREQWPIFDLDRTLQLCADQGIRHIFRGVYPEPFTIDFLVTEEVHGKITYRAASVKSVADAKNPKVRRRLSVEYLWCRERNIPWELIDTSSFNKTVLATLRFMRMWFRNRYTPDAYQADQFAKNFLFGYRTNVNVRTLIDATAKRLQISNNVADDLFSYCAWSNRIPASLQHPLLMNRPLILIGNHDA